MPESKTVAAAKELADLLPVKEVYRDALQPAIKQVGEFGGTILGLLNTLAAPIEILNIWADHQKAEVIAAIVEKVRKIPEGHRTHPTNRLLLGTLEGALLFFDESYLREFYLNLLAASIDSRNAGIAPASLLQTINAMEPEEARILQLLSQKISTPAIAVSALSTTSEPKTSTTVIPLFTAVGREAGCLKPEYTADYVYNLERLGLVEVLDMELKHSEYLKLEQHPNVAAAKSIIQDHNLTPHVSRRMVSLTLYGNRFCESCVLAPGQRLGDHDDDSTKDFASRFKNLKNP